MPQLQLLLIEDSEDDAELVVRALARGGFQVACERVDTADALVSALGSRQWDVAISDYTMPTFTGTAALHLLRERDPDLPFIFVSGTIGEDAAVAAMRTGAHDYIMKGQLKRLVPAVERELREAAVRRERRRSEQRLVYLAYHDPLTDLPNRTLMQDRLEQATRAASRDNKPLALLLMDLDHFKEVNDTLGHHAGDQVLQHVASRVRNVLRDVDTVARLGGDEFAVVLPFTDVEGGLLAARRVLQELQDPCLIEGHALSLHASIGIACYPEHGSSADTLLQRADVAMYFAKGDGSGIAVYAADRDRHSHRRLTLVTEMRQALDNREFVVEYQPILNLQTGVVSGVEALVRWNHPRHGVLLPSEFIHLAEQTGLIKRLTMMVLDSALADWSDALAPVPLTVAVNLSPRNLRDQDLPDRIAEILAAHGRPPWALALEITENILMTDPGRSMDVLKRLRALGVRLVIDDFGTGYSSLSYLRRLPVDELKIDRSFIQEFGAGHDEVIVRSTIDLAHNLGLKVVAEGVEHEATQQRLAELRCDAAQGIYICHPQSREHTREWMARHGALEAL